MSLCAPRRLRDWNLANLPTALQASESDVDVLTEPKDIRMKSIKRVIQSDLLGRMAHADAFEIGTSPEFLLVLFGGSGVEEDEYERRSRTVIPVFGPLLNWLSNRSLSLFFLYVSAPYDLPFNQFPSAPSTKTWNAHVTTELLEPWSNLPYFVSSFSGGTALALNGLQSDRRCFGGGALGADALSPDFVCPAHWSQKLRLYVTPQDRVCQYPDNRSVVNTLIDRGQAELVILESGGHAIADYSTEAGLGDLIHFAHSLTPK